MYSIMAMDALGYERDHPDFVEAVKQFEALIMETQDRLDLQALRLADLGHRDCDVCAGGNGHVRSGTHAARGRLDCGE